jgi:hypothetical protein
MSGHHSLSHGTHFHLGYVTSFHDGLSLESAPGESSEGWAKLLGTYAVGKHGHRRRDSRCGFRPARGVAAISHLLDVLGRAIGRYERLLWTLAVTLGVMGSVWISARAIRRDSSWSTWEFELGMPSGPGLLAVGALMCATTGATVHLVRNRWAFLPAASRLTS